MFLFTLYNNYCCNTTSDQPSTIKSFSSVLISEATNGHSKETPDGDVDDSVANGNHTEEEVVTPCPDFSKYLYFLSAQHSSIETPTPGRLRSDGMSSG